jgi:hypothetical protein
MIVYFFKLRSTMKTTTQLLMTFSLFLIGGSALAQKSVKEFVEKTDAEKIKKSIVMGPGFQPTVAGSYDDGHGKNPLLWSTDQLPDTIALITYYIYDIGTSNTIKNVSITHYSLTETGGNVVANAIYASTIEELKKACQAQGVVLLTPDQYLDTQEKRDYYYKTFTPKISKVGNFLSGLETKQADVAVTADNFRGFEVGATADYQRAESLGGDLCAKLGVDGVLSIAFELVSDKKTINMTGVKMGLNGPNPIAKMDKKYVGQNTGTGYYTGQLYSYGYFYFPAAIPVGGFEKDKIVNLNFEGTGTVLGHFIDKFYLVMNESIVAAKKKYGK